MRLHVVDGTYELFRAHFSPRPGNVAPGGQDVKATAGILRNMLALLNDAEEAVTHVAVAFDHPIRSFRNDLFAGYKTEEGVPPELLAQFDLAEEAVRALGMVAWPMDRFEADDAMATAAHRFASQVEQVRLLTPDKDLGQCVVGAQVVQVDRAQQKVMDEPGVFARLGVKPSQIPDYLGLVGDSADGIPGVDGWGPKTAAAVLAAHPNLESIPDDAAEWKATVRGAARLAANLKAKRKEAMLYRTLATVRRDVPLAEDLPALAHQGVPREAYEAFCAKLGLKAGAGPVKRWSAT